MRMRLLFLLVIVSIGLATAEGRVFDTEQDYVKMYGADINKGIPAPAPFKMALYKKKGLRIVVLFHKQVSEGELVCRPGNRLTEADVTGVLAINQGSSSWKKERVTTTNDPTNLQTSLWSRKDGKLFAAYVSSSSPIPFLIIGTRRGGDFLIKQKDNLARYIKE